MSDHEPATIQIATNAAIIENAVDAILTINPQNKIEFANFATHTLFGYAPGQLVGTEAQRLLPELEIGANLHPRGTSNQKINVADSCVAKNSIGKNRDGSTFPTLLTVIPIRFEGNNYFAVVVKDNRDVSERQARLEAILQNAVDAIITIDAKGLIDSINPATEHLFGYAVNELIGKNIKMLMPEPFHSQHDGYLSNYLNTGMKKIIGIGRQVTGKRKDGSTFPMHLAVNEFCVGARKMFTGIVRDISDLKAVEQALASMNEQLEEQIKERTSELREAQANLVRNERFATLGKVSGGIAHEIRNPLNAVKTSAYFLLNAESPSNEKVREHLQRIDRQVTLIDNVVTALSDVAKLPDANLVRTNLESVLRTAIASVNFTEDIEYQFDWADDVPDVLVDSNQIIIAFKNLLRNARDSLSVGGKISIETTVRDHSVVFHVRDNGSGIPPEDLEQILEPLFTTKARGMGLGLSITRTIVEKNRGKLLVESELGIGSCFSIELQRA